MTMAARKLWGEMEEEEPDDTVFQNVNFDPIIELAMQNIPEIPITVKSSPIELPKPNLITHTIQLHEYASQLSAIVKQAETAVFETSLESLTLPTMPPPHVENVEHIPNKPMNFIEKEYCDFSYGQGPSILPFSPESHQRALKQCAAIAIAHVGIPSCSNSALTALTDALDIYMTTICRMMRTVTDKEARGLHSGFPDIISKVFAELGIVNLHDFYENRVVRYHKQIMNQCEKLRGKCETIISGDMAPQLKLEEVPELHFPAALDGAFTPSLEPGFQMLQSLEQEQLQGLEILDAVQEIKIEQGEYVNSELTSKPNLSPNAKKRKK